MKLSKEYNLLVINPKLCKEWDYEKNKFNPENYTPHSHKKAYWICKKGHKWKAIIKSRTNNCGCPYCSNRKVYKDNCLATKNPRLVKEWNYEKNRNLTPYDVFLHSPKKVWWICKKGHEWKQSPNNRNYNDCPYCSNMKICKDNCLETLNPELAKEWNYEKNKNLTPKMVGICSGKKVWWKCKKGHEWNALISSRNLGVNCPFCSNKKVCKDNCLATLNPELAKEWNYEKNKSLTPKMFGICSGKKVWWICEKGHEWECSIIYKNKGSCPYCSNRKLCKDNCLATLNPELSKEWNYEKNGDLTPYDVFLNSTKKVWWICEKGHEWISDVHHRNNKNGCPKCAKRISKGCKVWLDKLNIENREKHIKISNINYYADGFVKSTNTIYEFLGDFYHGNPVFFNPNKINKKTKSSFFKLLYKTIKKLNNCSINGYNIIYKWEGLNKEYEYKFINLNKDIILKCAYDIFINNKKENIFELLVSIGD